jgi:hypothetical protein
VTCAFQTKWVGGEDNRLAHNPEVTCTKYACPWTEEFRERRSTARLRVDARRRPHRQSVLLCTGHVRKSSLTGPKDGGVGAWPVVTVTDQGNAIRAPVHVNVFQHGVAKMDESKCV